MLKIYYKKQVTDLTMQPLPRVCTSVLLHFLLSQMEGWRLYVAAMLIKTFWDAFIGKDLMYQRELSKPRDRYAVEYCAATYFCWSFSDNCWFGKCLLTSPRVNQEGHQPWELVASSEEEAWVGILRIIRLYKITPRASAWPKKETSRVLYNPTAKLCENIAHANFSGNTEIR